MLEHLFHCFFYQLFLFHFITTKVLDIPCWVSFFLPCLWCVSMEKELNHHRLKPVVVQFFFSSFQKKGAQATA